MIAACWEQLSGCTTGLQNGINEAIENKLKLRTILRLVQYYYRMTWVKAVSDALGLGSVYGPWLCSYRTVVFLLFTCF